MKNLFLTIFPLLLSFFTHGQNWEWAIEQPAYGMVADSAGNLYIPFSINSNAPGTLIKKLNSQGQLTWVKLASGIFSIHGHDVDKAGNIYVVGEFNNLSIDGYNFTSNGNYDIFIGKFNQAGNLIWYKQYGGPGHDRVSDFFLGENQQFYLSINADSGAVIENVNIQEKEFFVVNIDSSGTVNVPIHYSGAKAWEVAADTNNNIYLLAGYNYDTVDLGNGILFLPHESGYYSYHYVIKFDPAGNALWLKNLGDDYMYTSENLSVCKNGDLYLSLDGDYNGFGISKYNSSGIQIWGRWINADAGSCSSVYIDRDDNVWLTGSLWDEQEVKHFPYIWKFDSSGALLDTIIESYKTSGHNIVSDYNNNYYVTGSFRYYQNFGGTTLYAPQTSYFLAKFNNYGPQTNFLVSNPKYAITIFPNPSSGSFTIHSTEKISSISITNLLGEKVFLQSVPLSFGEGLGVRSYQPAGIYFLKIISKNKESIQKIILN